ncbi:MAG: M14 family zinc carboxypeptidase [Acidobacteriota bacterium]
MQRLIVLTVLSGLFLGVAPAQTPQQFDFFERGPYREGIPRPQDILGYAIGERHSYSYQMEDYIHALERATSRVKILQYGRSYEGRTLHLVLISAEENMQRLESTRAATDRLADPRQISADEVQQVVGKTPATVWLNFANDGNESAAFETGMQIAYQLAAGEDETTHKIRRQVLTIVNPAHNPESHDRFVAWYRSIVTGPNGNPDPNAVEHEREWLMNSNDTHFHVDPNRDAFRLSQVETRAVVRQFHRWHPQVFIDHHGNPPIFYFPPVAKPINENFPASSRKWEDTFGRAIGAEFDRFGWPYMNREVYDLHYPGYFDSYPSLNGAIGMTFETDGGGSQGLQLERPDGTRSTLRGAIAKHYSGSLAVLTAVADDRETLLRDYYNFRQSGMEEAEHSSVKQFVLLESGDPSRAASLADLLRQHKIEVHRTTDVFVSRRVHNYFNDAVETREFPPGAYVIRTQQPQKRLLTALLEREAKLNKEFVEVARERMERNLSLGRRAGRERLGFYDITAWSLPLSFGVEAYWTEDAPSHLQLMEESVSLPKGVSGGEGRHGYLFKPRSNAGLKLMSRLFQEGFKMLVTRTSLKVAGETFPAGSILLRTSRNPETLGEQIRSLAEETGVQVWAVDSAWTTEGPSLGTRMARDLKAPKVAIAAYEPTRGRSFGHLWFYFEAILGYPFTPIRTERFGSLDLSKYDVIIFPDGSDAGYERRLGKNGIEKLDRWIRDGGVFLGLKGGAAFATRPSVGWTSSFLYGRPPPKDAKVENREAIEKEVQTTPGAILRVELNNAHFLSFGYGSETLVLHNSGYIFSRSKEGSNVATYADEKARVSGFIWDSTERRIGGTSYLIDENLGRGQVILFAGDPLFRLLWPSLERMFTHAVFLAPSLR